MSWGVPLFGLRAYALFYSRHGVREPFGQSELDWIVSPSMRKKIFSVLLNAGWLRKTARDAYQCEKPDEVLRGLLTVRVPALMKDAARPYAFAGVSAIEAWSDYSYVQRGVEKYPQVIAVLKKDVAYWKRFFREREVPVYVNEGGTVGEYVVLKPVERVAFEETNGLRAIPLREAAREARENPLYAEAYRYLKERYGDRA